jgi:hypothetical protein
MAENWKPRARTVYAWTDLLFIGKELGYHWNQAHDIVIWCNPKFHAVTSLSVDKDELADRDEDSQKILGEFFSRIGNPETVEFIGD